MLRGLDTATSVPIKSARAEAAMCLGEEEEEEESEEEEVLASFSFECFFFTATDCCSFDPERFASKLLGLKGEDMLVILL